tara:strand:- start:1 stop:420 length:420 start_codon:yes stop_codon:yes gene_type:complete
MDHIVTFRTFKDGDYDMCCEWWRWWWDGEIPVRRQLLPDDKSCYVIESNGIPVAAGFLFTFENPLVGYGPTWVVSNPNYKEKNRRQMLELLISSIEKDAKETFGMVQLFTVCGNRFLQDIHKKLDWFMMPAKYEAFKYL